MLHKRDALTVETKEILRAITMFGALEDRQVVKLLYGQEQNANIIIRNLCRQNRVHYDRNTGLITVSQQSVKEPDADIVKAFWVFLEFNDKAEYYTAGDYPALINFFAKEEHYEIIRAVYGNEVTLNFVLSNNISGAKQLIIIDSQIQIKKIKAPNLLCFCIVADDGAVQFFKLE